MGFIAMFHKMNYYMNNTKYDCTYCNLMAIHMKNEYRNQDTLKE